MFFCAQSFHIVALFISYAYFKIAFFFCLFNAYVLTHRYFPYFASLCKDLEIDLLLVAVFFQFNDLHQLLSFSYVSMYIYVYICTYVGTLVVTTKRPRAFLLFRLFFEHIHKVISTSQAHTRTLSHSHSQLKFCLLLTKLLASRIISLLVS